MNNLVKTYPHMTNKIIQMQHHFVEHGSSFAEAVTHLNYGTVEKYANIMALKRFEHCIEYMSYKALSSRNNCVPLEYLGILDVKQQKNINKIFYQYCGNVPTENDIIAWILCPSLFKPGHDIYVPAQLLFLGFQSNQKYNDKLFIASFSGGVAAGFSLEQAFKNALMKVVQADACMLNWYTDSAKAFRVDLTVNDYGLLKKVGLDRKDSYQINVSYLTRPEISLPNIGITLLRKNKKIPYMVCALGTEITSKQALLKAATAVKASLVKSSMPFTDLDSNVLYFANLQDGEQKLEVMKSRLAGVCGLASICDYADSTQSAIYNLIGDMSKISRWGVYLDITPPEFLGTSWKVVKVLVPELLGMCLPGFPAKAHPRMLAYGGVKNLFAHPFGLHI